MLEAQILRVSLIQKPQIDSAWDSSNLEKGSTMNLENRLRKFVGDQDNLDATYWLMKGLSYREVGERIGRSHSFVQRVNNFLRNQGIVTGRQWGIDVNAMKMTRAFEFYDYSGSFPKKVDENDEFLTYFAEIKKGTSAYFALYTFPDEISPETNNTISPYYYHVPEFKAPLDENRLTQDEFLEVLETKNNENPLPPRGEAIEPDLIHIEIARYVELFGNPKEDKSTHVDAERLDRKDLREINLWKFVEIIAEDMREEKLVDAVDVTYDMVRSRYSEMLKKNIIYPGFGLDMRKFGYVLSFCWIKYEEIYRILKTFSNFNIVSALACTQNNSYLLHLQYPREKELEVFRILNSLDHGNEVFKVLDVYANRTLPFSYFFKKEREKKQKRPNKLRPMPL